MFKASLFVAAVTLTLGVASAAHAYSFRPGSEPSGGRIGKICNTQFLSDAEQSDCIAKMKAAKNDAERREIRDTIREATKERQKEADIENERLNAGSDPSRARQ